MRRYASPSLIKAGTVRTLTQLDGPLGVEDGSGSSLLPTGPEEPPFNT